MHPPAAPRPVGHVEVEPALHLPVLRFDLEAQTAQLQQTDAWRTSSGPSSTTLAHHSDLRVVLVAMRRGTRMADHRTVARITVQALRGKLRMHLRGGREDLTAGDVLILDRGIGHDVEAIEDCSFLLTLAWPAEETTA